MREGSSEGERKNKRRDGFTQCGCVTLPFATAKLHVCIDSLFAHKSIATVIHTLM